MIHVTHYMRRPISATYSVERLYADIRTRLPMDIRTCVCVNRFFPNSLFGRLYDIGRAWPYQGDVNHVTGDVHYLTYLLNRRRTILTILDCGSLERLHGFKRWLLWLLWYWLPEKRCAAIVVISEATRRQVLRHLRCDPSKIQVIYCNVSEEFKPQPKSFNIDRPHLLQIGTTANKNLERLAAALEGLNCDLTIVGLLSSTQIQILQRHGICYENLVDLSREALLEQYQRCDMVAFVSTYEGFGLPIVEANAVGRPVVTSNLLSMPEVAGDAACLVDPFDVDSIRAGIIKVMEDAAYREYLVEKGLENAQRFQTKTIAEQYTALYRKIYADSNRDSGIPA